MTAEILECGAVLDAASVAAMVGVAAEDLPTACRQAIDGADLRHEVLRGADRAQCLAEAERICAESELRPSGPHRQDDWEQGWSENLRDLDAARAEGRGDERSALVPKYNRHRVLRLCGDWVRAASPSFEYDVYTALREFWFDRWFADCARVVEFGCGTGTSLLLLAERFPYLDLVGTDWASSSQQILQRLSSRTPRLTARRFDMFAPDRSLALGPGTGVLTSAAMEQLGAGHGAFVDYLVEARPAVCLHVEPLAELYDDEDPFDAVALRYHEKRNYLRGFLPRLWQLEAEGRIEILEQRRTGFGSFCHEGYSVVVWRPSGVAAGRA